jgi:hypothetical protein
LRAKRLECRHNQSRPEQLERLWPAPGASPDVIRYVFGVIKDARGVVCQNPGPSCVSPTRLSDLFQANVCQSPRRRLRHRQFSILQHEGGTTGAWGLPLMADAPIAWPDKGPKQRSLFDRTDRSRLSCGAGDTQFGAGGDPTAWLGRDSNLRMAESKSSYFA